MAGIAAGELDRRLDIQRPITSLDALNQPVQTGWETLAQPWAKRTAVSGSDQVEGAQPGLVSTHRFLVRWQAVLVGLGASDQLVCEGVTYAIDRVEEMGRRIGFLIWATARPGVGA